MPRSRCGKRSRRSTCRRRSVSAPGSASSRRRTSHSSTPTTGSKAWRRSLPSGRRCSEGNDVLALPVVRLKKERSKSARAGHPWLFSGAFEALPQLEPGSLCRVEDEQGKFVAIGYANASRGLAVRLLSWREIDSVQTLL